MTILALLIATAQPPAAELGWLSGYWLSCADGYEVSETWSDPRAGILIGTGTTLSSDGKLSWEAMRIGPSGDGIAFFAQPSGQPAAEFRLKSAGLRQAVFENLAHDFPQRVSYRRVGDRLIGRVEGTIGGKLRVESWSYDAAALNTRCTK